MKNKTITIYELIGLIKDNKAPKQVKYDGIELIYSTLKEDYMGYYSNGNGDYLLQYLFDKCRNTSHFINDKVEILSEENDEWEDIREIEILDFSKEPNDNLKDIAIIINQLIKNQKRIIEKLESKNEKN